MATGMLVLGSLILWFVSIMLTAGLAVPLIIYLIETLWRFRW